MNAIAEVNAGRLVEGLGHVAGADASGAWNADGVRLEFGDASLRQLRQLAGWARLGSGVWRAGAAKADLLAALRGEIVSFDVREPDPRPAQQVAQVKVDPNDIVHRDFDRVLRAVRARVPVWLVGPAGCGKSSLAKRIAEALGIPFEAKSVSAQSSESSLMGFIDAHGNLVRSPLREAFENGGLFLLDEVDAGSPAVMVVLNSLVANRWASFPDGLIEAHPDFRIIAGANCYGSGSDRQYVGRQQQDAAMLDRFAFVGMEYDPRIERNSMGLPPDGRSKSPEDAQIEKWYDRVLAVRRKCSDQKIRHIISPRASIMGAAMLRDGGIAWSDIEQMLLRKGLADDVWDRIK
jgi:hypothetical protein